VVTPLAVRLYTQRVSAVAFGTILLAASLLKLWSDGRYSVPLHRSWLDIPAISETVTSVEALLGLALVAGLWREAAWYAAISAFSLFAIITAVEAAKGKDSCGCFGAVQVRPIYTTCLDIAAVAALLLTGRPSRRSRG